MNDKRAMTRHFLASLAYRTQKAVRDTPPDYADFRTEKGVRTPHELLLHMTGVLTYARGRFTQDETRPKMLPTFEAEIARFHEVLGDLSTLLASDAPLVDTTPEQLLQGPFSDAMTHAGQLAMLKRLAGCPIPPENFIEADVDAENVGPEQAAPVSPDEDWREAEDEAR